VTGQGPIAFACVLAGRALQWPMAVLGRDEPDSFRSHLVQRLGAKYHALSQFGSEPVEIEQDGFDLILECTGSDEVLMHAARWLASCGVMVWLGSSRMPKARMHNLDVLMRNAVLRNHVHLGTVNAAPRDFAAALEHLALLQKSSAVEVAAVLTDRVPLQDALWHYRHRVPQGIKTVVTYDS
jgi:glucose 1-dehydrogenase